LEDNLKKEEPHIKIDSVCPEAFLEKRILLSQMPRRVDYRLKSKIKFKKVALQHSEQATELLAQ
jgi:hypothetical protein